MAVPETTRLEYPAAGSAFAACAPAPPKQCALPLPTRVAFVGNYLPRECGIATFTTDLCNAVAGEYGAERLFAIPVNDPDSSYEYPEQVRLELTQEDVASYKRAADFLNFNGNDLVCLQHEYGIYGGAAGRHILSLLRRLKMPLVTTLHTVLREPDADQRAVLEEIARLSDRLVVMSELAAQMLREVYAVPSGKIDVIPHGVPEMQFMDPNYYKDKFGTEGKSVLLTFGLLSPNKGIEDVIRALPAILRRHPNVVYIVSGVTHPHIRKREGERYREGLRALAEELGVSAQLILNNRFVSAEELVEHVGAADIYITPYKQEAQIVSGTLAYTVGAGKAVISTPYWYAQEMLADLDQLQAKLETLLGEQEAWLDRLYFCPHHPKGTIPEYAKTCDCRKPGIGLIQQAAKDFTNINLSKSYVIGDKLIDIELAKNAGCKGILVRTGYGSQIANNNKIKPDYTANTIEDAVNWIIKDLNFSNII